MTLPGPLRGMLLSVGAYVLFTGFDTVSKYCARQVSIFEVMAVEFSTAALLMIAFTLVKHRRRPLWAVFRFNRPELYAARCGAQILGQSLTFLAISHLTLGEFYIIIFSVPIIAVFLAQFLLKEVPVRYVWPVLGINFAGVLIALRPDHGTSSWAIVALCGAFVLACGVIALRKMMESEAPEIASIASASALAVSSLLVTIFVFQPVPFSTFALMMLGGAFFAPGQLMVSNAFRLAPAAIVMPPQFLQLAYGALAGFVVFGDVPKLSLYIGGAIVIGANGFLIFVQSRRRHETRDSLIAEPLASPGLQRAQVGNALRRKA
jgi:drug/metabolite transporter (DMT)-like permease